VVKIRVNPVPVDPVPVAANCVVSPQSRQSRGANTVRINIGTSCAELEDMRGGSPYYFYASGGSSPSDTLDSGTCSDLDGSTPPPLPKKQGVTVTVHQRGGSLTSSGPTDSDDEISCDSLNSSELDKSEEAQEDIRERTARVSLAESTSIRDSSDVRSISLEESGDHQRSDRSHRPSDNDHRNSIEALQEAKRISSVTLADSRSISRDPPTDYNRSSRNHENSIHSETDRQRTSRDALENKIHSSDPAKVQNTTSDIDNRNTTHCGSNKSVRHVEPTNDDHRPLLKQVSNGSSHSDSSCKSGVVEERTYDERRTTPDDAAVINPDSFYNFHLNENSFEPVVPSVRSEEEDHFAGARGFQEGDLQTSTIRSSRGTIRGVKNRVRAGIATFLQMHATKSWQEKEAGKVVMYTTTMGIVRATYQRCLKVRQILRTHLVKFEEKDVFMSRETQAEIKERMSTDHILVPQLFIEGQYIGDAEVIERLNESGELRRILKPYKSPDACTTCPVCGGYRLLPCAVCNGSKKSVHRNHFTTELVALKCMNCDEVGLVKCYAC